MITSGVRGMVNEAYGSVAWGRGTSAVDVGRADSDDASVTENKDHKIRSMTVFSFFIIKFLPLYGCTINCLWKYLLLIMSKLIMIELQSYLFSPLYF